MFLSDGVHLYKGNIDRFAIVNLICPKTINTKNNEVSQQIIQHVNFITLIKFIFMSYTERLIVETYSDLFEGLSSLSKIELIESLSKSLKTEKATTDKKFYKSFGAFSSTKSADEIIRDIKKSRTFKNREVKF